MPIPPPGKLSGLADNIQAFAKNLSGSVDDIDSSISRLSNYTEDLFDDIIRDGSHFDEFGNLKPNVTYQAGEFEYIYKTDELGRLKEWDAEDLHLTDRVKRLKHDPNTPGKIKGVDHAGHLADDRFGGSPLRDNLVSQLSGVNLSDYKKLENQWVKAIDKGKDVSVSVKINYIDDDLRPNSFDIEYIIDGEIKKKRINNF